MQRDNSGCVMDLELGLAGILRQMAEMVDGGLGKAADDMGQVRFPPGGHEHVVVLQILAQGEPAV